MNGRVQSVTQQSLPAAVSNINLRYHSYPPSELKLHEISSILSLLGYMQPLHFLLQQLLIIIWYVSAVEYASWVEAWDLSKRLADECYLSTWWPISIKCHSSPTFTISDSLKITPFNCYNTPTLLKTLPLNASSIIFLSLMLFREVPTSCLDGLSLHPVCTLHVHSQLYLWVVGGPPR